jgi:hypothetical protein
MYGMDVIDPMSEDVLKIIKQEAEEDKPIVKETKHEPDTTMFQCMIPVCRKPMFTSEAECQKHVRLNHRTPSCYITTTSKNTDRNLKIKPVVIMKRLEEINLPAIQKKLEDFSLDIDIKQEKIGDEDTSYEIDCSTCNIKAKRMLAKPHDNSEIHLFFKKYPELRPSETEVIKRMTNVTAMNLFRGLKVYCDTCERSMSVVCYPGHKDSRIHRHFLTHPNEVPRYAFKKRIEKNVRVCGHCNAVYKTKIELTHHKRLHKKEKADEFACRFCKEKFENLQLFRQHLFTKNHASNKARYMAEKLLRSSVKIPIKQFPKRKSGRPRGPKKLKDPNKIPKRRLNMLSKTRTSARYEDVERRKCERCQLWIPVKIMKYHISYTCGATHLKKKVYECDICGTR